MTRGNITTFSKISKKILKQIRGEKNGDKLGRQIHLINNIE